MSVILSLKKNLIAGLVLSGSVAVPVATLGASSLSKSGVEYPLLPTLPRDQVVPHLSLNAAGGYIVSQDATVDGNGYGIRARRLNPDLTAARTTFAVNSITAGDQQNARVAMLPDGGAAFAWQSSTGTGNRIYVRFMVAGASFTSAEVTASTTAQGHQSDAAIAALADGSVVVVWAETDRDGSMQGIYGQRFSGTGARIGTTFQVNNVTYLNQRTPTITALPNGGFVVAYVSEEFRQRNSEYIDIVARIYNAQGAPVGSEIRLNSSENICANPAITATADGFRAAWSSKKLGVQTVVSVQNEGLIVRQGDRRPGERWDVRTRSFSASGQALGEEVVVNTTREGDQFSPRLVSFNGRELVLWTSWGQDSSYEGIIGRIANGPSIFDGDEFIVNTRTSMNQVYPTAAVAGDKVLVAWSSFISAAAGFDVVAQQFSISADLNLATPATPFAASTGQNSISVTWAEVGANEVDTYRIYVDGETTPIESTAGMVTILRPEWVAGSTHTVRMSYRLKDGRVSPLSGAATVVTWGEDKNGDSLPDEWQTENWGKQANWPLANVDSDGDGASNSAEFLAGTDPTDATSVLKVTLSTREQGVYLEWPTTAGRYYQLQVSSNLKNWTNVGAARFATSTSDSVPMEGPGQIQYYRLIRMR